MFKKPKEFIAASIAAQAQRDATPLSDIERKMLLFSEVGWAPPDIMEASDEFDRQYDPNEYEKKISTIIKHLDKRLQKDSPAEYDDWKSAVQYLRPKDHYVNVMIGQAGLRPPHDQLKLFLWALVVIAAFAGWFFISTKYNLGRYFPSQKVMGRSRTTIRRTCSCGLIAEPWRRFLNLSSSGLIFEPRKVEDSTERIWRIFSPVVPKATTNNVTSP